MVPSVDEKVTKKVTWPQWIAGIGVTLLLMQIGIMAGWSSPYIAQLLSEDSQIPITLVEASWVVSFMNFGRLMGAVGGSLCVNYFGSKTTILVTCLPVTLCWIFTVIADQVEWLYASRFFGGVGLGMTYSSFSLYLGEIADPHIRGALVALGMAGVSVGNLVICIMGAYMPMEMSGAISLIFCVILMLLFIWLPESPHYLVKNNMDEKAKASILWYHRDCDVEAEFAVLRKFVTSFNSNSFVDTLNEMKTGQIRRALLLMAALFMYSQMCGLNNIMFYMETILRTAKVDVIEPAVVVIFVMVFGIAASCLSMFLIDRCGRKILMICSCSIVTIALLTLGTEFQLLSYGFEPSKIQALPIIGIALFHVSVFIGILSVPSAILSEIFPPHVKCMAACFGSVAAAIFSFISTATYQPLISVFSEQYIFYFYALLLMTAIPFTILFVPETKGKSLQEIQLKLMKRG